MKPAPKSGSAGIRQRQGDKLKLYRQSKIADDGKLGVTQEQVAKAIGVTKASVSDWEGGKSSPRPHHQVALARYFGAPWSVLFGLDGEAA
jgi:DNA-binding XRE family transcriptional regulator